MSRIEALPSSAVPLDWRSPIRVGFLLDPASQALRAEVERRLAPRYHLRPHVRVAGVDQARAFDILVVPVPLAGARELLLASPVVVQANLLLLFDRSAGARETALTRIAALRELTLAHGVALVPVAEGREVEWLLAVIDSLAQGAPLARALDNPYFLEAGRQVWLLADRALPAAMTAAYREAALRRPTRAAPPAGEPEPEWPMPTIETFRKPGQDAYSVPPDGYSLEREEELTRSPTGEERPAAREPERPGRFLQARVEERARRRCEVAVKIGPPESGALMAERPFPEGELPEDEAGHQLTVVLSEPNLLEKPEVRTIFLPRDGASTACLFELVLPAARQTVEARIVVLFENRVLQTALLTGRAGGPWKLALEMIVRPEMRNLSRQRSFDGALILNHTGDGVPRATVMGGYQLATFSVVGLEGAIELMEAQINGTPWDDPAFASLDAPGSVELLLVLASHGERLYRELLRYAPGHPLLTGDGPVQLISTENGAPLPLELLYSRQAPNDDAVLCSNWRAALETGACDCPDDGSVVCPLGFWCFRRVIERHRFSPEHGAETAGRAYALKDVPAGEEAAALKPLAGVAVGASARVSAAVAGAFQSLVDALSRQLARPIEPAHDWDDWARQVQATSPSLLILLPHTATNPRFLPTLEINGASLPSNRIRREHVVGPAGKPHPIVLLLGCNTDNRGLPFESFVPSFADQQAAVIVTSLSKILGRHAAPLAALFVEQLAAFPNDGKQRFGEVMREVRRRAALDGPPLALVLKAYGDADWRI